MGGERHRRVLVTGATGFLGGHVVTALLEAGLALTCLVRGESPPALTASPVRLVRGDLLDPGSLARACKGVTAVVHAAGLVSTRPRDKQRLWLVNVVGARNLLAAAAAAGVQRVVFTSSTSAVGAFKKDLKGEAWREETPFNLENLPVPYVKAKRAAHEAALEARQQGLPVVLLSPSFVLGPGDRHLTSSELVAAFVRRRLPAVLAGGLNPVDVRDLASAYVAALRLEHPAPHYILAGSENITMKAFFERLAALSGHPAPRWRLPRPLALGAAGLSQWLFPGSSFSLAAVHLGSLYWYFDAAAARRDLGFKTRPLDETLQASLEWVASRVR